VHQVDSKEDSGLRR